MLRMELGRKSRYLRTEAAGVVYLQILPWEAATEQTQQGVDQRLQVVPPAGSPPQVGMAAGKPGGAPASATSPL